MFFTVAAVVFLYFLSNLNPQEKKRHKMTDWQCQRKISKWRQHSVAAASFRDPAYLSSLRKILAVFNNIWLMDEQPGRLEDEAECGLRNPLGCPAHCRLLLTNPWGQHSTRLQALPWLQRCSHPRLNPNDPLSKLTMDLCAVGGNAGWGVGDTAMPAKPYSVEVRSHGERGLLSHTLQSSKAWQAPG